MQCEFCYAEFNQGEYLVPIYTYWAEEHLSGEAYNDGVKRRGWAHVWCVPG